MDRAQHWDDRYRTDDSPWDTGRPAPELMRVISEEGIQPCRVIELGCGTGTNAIWLAQQGFDVTAVDISALAIQRARDIASKVAVRFITADVLDPPSFGDPFPFFFDRGCYHVVRRIDVNRYLQTLDEVTAGGANGLILAGNANDEQHEPGPPVVSEEEIRGEIGRVFDIEWLREFRFDPKPGSKDNFLAWSCFVKKRR